MGEAIGVLKIPRREERLRVSDRRQERGRTVRSGQRAEEKVRENAIRSHRRISIRFYIFIALAVLTVGLLFFTMMGYNEISSLSNEIADLESEISVMEAEHDYLSMKLGPYVSRGRIENLAKTRLNMVYPEGDQLVSIQPDDKAFPSTVARTQEVQEGDSRTNSSIFASVSRFFQQIFK